MPPELMQILNILAQAILRIQEGLMLPNIIGGLIYLVNQLLTQILVLIGYFMLP